MLLQVSDPLLGFVDRRNVRGGDPPQRHDGRLELLEPVATLPRDFGRRQGCRARGPDPQRDALAYPFLSLHGHGFTVAQIFWGLWLFPFGVLVIRSGFIPRFLGVLLIIAGVGNLASAVTALVLPQYVDRVSPFAMALGFGELPIIFWLLIWGAKPQPAAAQPS